MNGGDGRASSAAWISNFGTVRKVLCTCQSVFSFFLFSFFFFLFKTKLLCDPFLQTYFHLGPLVFNFLHPSLSICPNLFYFLFFIKAKFSFQLYSIIFLRNATHHF